MKRRGKILLANLGLFLLVSACAHPERLTSENLYEKLNLRSFYSSFTPSLKENCHSYLSDYFKRKDNAETRLDPAWLTIETDDWSYRFQMVSDTPPTVAFEDMAKYGNYHTRGLLRLNYDAKKEEWSVGRYEPTYSSAEEKSVYNLPPEQWTEVPFYCNKSWWKK